MSNEMTQAPEQMPVPITIEQMMLTALQENKVEALERLVALKERQDFADAERAFNVAMVAAEAEMPVVERAGYNDETGQWYVKLDSLHARVLPVARQHGFAFSFDTADCPVPNHMRIVCHCLHKSGHSRDYRLDFAIDNTGPRGGPSKTVVDGEASTITRARKALTLMIFNIQVPAKTAAEMARETDEPITAEQAADLRALLQEYNRDEARFCAFCKINRVEDLPARLFKSSIDKIRAVQR